MYVGGGLGAVPHQAKLFDEFVPEDELLPIAQAIARVFARLGEKRNRARARIKFLVKSLGIDEFRRLVLEERAKLRARSALDVVPPEGRGRGSETPLKSGAALNGAAQPDGFAAWHATNVYRAAPAGLRRRHRHPAARRHHRAIRCARSPTSSRKYVGDTVRTTVEQNIVLRWVSEADLPDLYRRPARRSASGTPGAQHDRRRHVVPGHRHLQARHRLLARPGAASCAIAWPRSRSPARRRGAAACTSRSAAASTPAASITSPTSASTASAATVGGYHGAALPGRARRPVERQRRLLRPADRRHPVEEHSRRRRSPHRPLRAASARAARPSSSSAQRIGKKALKEMLDEFVKVPAHDADPDYYSDWGDPREFTHRRHGHRRVRRRGRVAGRVRPRRRRARSLRSAAGARGRRRREGRRRWPTTPCCRRRRRW